MPLFEARRVSKVYASGTSNEVRAVDNVSLQIAAGEFCALSGPSGSGKTTLLALLGAMLRPSGGTVLVAGTDLTACGEAELSRTRRRLGFVFQDYSLLPRVPVWQNVAYPLIPQGCNRHQQRTAAEAILRRLDLAEKADALPDQLSTGQQQRVAVARALVAQPIALLADEPTSNLDAASAGQLISLFQECHAEGLTIVVATHDPALLQAATQHLPLEQGRLLDASTESTRP